MSDEMLSVGLAIVFLLLLAAWVPVVGMLQRVVERTKAGEKTVPRRGL